MCLTDPYYWKYYHINKNKSLTYIAPNDESENNMSENYGSKCNTNYKECQNCAVKDYCSGIWESTYEIEPDKSKIIRKVNRM